MITYYYFYNQFIWLISISFIMLHIQLMHIIILKFVPLEKSICQNLSTACGVEWNGWNLAPCTRLCQWVTLIDRWRLCHIQYDRLQYFMLMKLVIFNILWKFQIQLLNFYWNEIFNIFNILFKIGEIRNFITNGTWYEHDTKLCLLPFSLFPLV